MKRLLKLTALLFASILATGPARSQETEIRYLSGKGKDDAVKWQFRCTGGRQSGKWDNIPVPSCWELQGYGTYNYGHDGTTTARQPTKPKANEKGRYRYCFTVPSGWQDKQVYIFFEGVMTDAEVWINKKSAGPMHQGAFYRFKYNITDLLNYGGDNLLEVTVSKQSANPSVNRAERDADYWVFGGIFRPVYLKAYPEQFIERTAIDARADGRFSIDVYLTNCTDANKVTAQIFTAQGKTLGKAIVAIVSAGAEKIRLQTKVSGHRTWTAETPHLYYVKVSLNKSRRPIHLVTERFGFRTVEVRPGDGVYVNGRRIILKGVNRHCFWPDSGRTTSRAVSIRDVKLIKQMNMNAVRMSHYPPDEHFLDACDELGLYVLDELAGWGGGREDRYDTEVGRKLVKEMVTRDINHCCIIFWDNGNEGGWNRELDGEFAKYDPQKRVVLHPDAKRFPPNPFNNVYLFHYPDYKKLKHELAGENIVLTTEFLHGLYDGGHGAGLNDYWKLMLKSKTSAGCFLWALIDEGVVRTDKNGKIDVDGNHAPDGIVGPYREKEGSFYAVKEIWSPIFIGLEELPANFQGQIEVENRYDFTNLNKCRFEWKLAKFPDPWDSQTGHIVLDEGIAQNPSVIPGSKGMLKLDLPNNWQEADAIYLTAIDPYGQQIWTWSWKIRRSADYCAEYVKKEIGKIKTSDNGTHLFVQAGNLELRFSKRTGQLAGVKVKGKTFSIGNGPRLLAGRSRFSSLQHYQDKDNVVVEVKYTGNLDYVRWMIYPSGRVKLSYQYKLAGEFELMGVTFDYPEDRCKRMKWLGKGPYRVWKNRLKGTQLGVWSNDYNDNIPGVTWIYPQFKGYYADWHWVVFDTSEGKISVFTETDNLFLGVYRPVNGPDPRSTELVLPESGISFLHAIPAISTKFTPAEQLGPASQKNKASGKYQATIYFHFDSK